MRPFSFLFSHRFSFGDSLHSICGLGKILKVHFRRCFFHGKKRFQSIERCNYLVHDDITLDKVHLCGFHPNFFVAQHTSTTYSSGLLYAMFRMSFDLNKGELSAFFVEHLNPLAPKTKMFLILAQRLIPMYACLLLNLVSTLCVYKLTKRLDSRIQSTRSDWGIWAVGNGQSSFNIHMCTLYYIRFLTLHRRWTLMTDEWSWGGLRHHWLISRYEQIGTMVK